MIVPKPNISVQYTTLADGWRNGALIPKGLVLHSTAWPGMNAQNIRDYFNAPNRGASIHAAVDDTQIVQCMPWDKVAGHVGGGKNGSFNYSHIGVEMCEPKGLTYNSSGSVIVAYNPPEGYFKAVWNNAVELFAHLCRQYNFDPLKKGVIVSHAEAYRMGVGGNHGDPEHWFRWEGVTMDDFRQAVNDRLNSPDKETEEVNEVRYNKISEIPDYAQPTIIKMVDKGLLNGGGKAKDEDGRPADLDLSVDMIRVFMTNDRAGLYD